MTNIVVLDDDKTMITRINKILNTLEIPSLQIQSFENVQSFIDNLNNFPDYTIFLLDIILEKSDGIEIAKLINENTTGAIIIFISAYLSKAPDVYDTNHCYFIYKPQFAKRLPVAIDKAINLIKHKKNTLIIKLKDRSVIIPCSQIYYLERNKRITNIYKSKTNISTYHDLDYFTTLLPDVFIRCHRSYIVNLTKVVSISRSEFILDDDTSIPISRSYQKNVHQLFHQYLLNY